MKTHIHLGCILLFLGILILPNCQLFGQGEKTDILPTDNLKEILSKTVSNEGLPGIVAAIIDSNGIVQIGSAGVRKLGVDESITDSDKLHLGSCSKAMTSALLSIIVEEGDLRWESTIAEVLSELKDSIHANYHDVSMYQLVRHRGGVPANAFWWGYMDQEIKQRRKSLIMTSLKAEPAQKVGDFLYSNLGYVIAGAMVEKVTGQSWEELMQEKLFDPLEMSSAGFGTPGEKDKIDQPWGHTDPWGGGLNPTQQDNAPAIGPAGTVHCTIEDWGKFIAFLFLKQNQSLLPKPQLENLKTPIGEYAAGWMKTERDWGKGAVYSHSGSNNAWLSLAWVAPETGKAYLVVTNSYNQKTARVCDGVISHLLKIDGAIE